MSASISRSIKGSGASSNLGATIKSGASTSGSATPKVAATTKSTNTTAVDNASTSKSQEILSVLATTAQKFAMSFVSPSADPATWAKLKNESIQGAGQAIENTGMASGLVSGVEEGGKLLADIGGKALDKLKKRGSGGGGEESSEASSAANNNRNSTASTNNDWKKNGAEPNV
jgi:hypothetical protein